MEQRCHLAMVWLTWLGLPLLAGLMVVKAGILAGVLVLAVGIAGQLLYVRWFPYFSKPLGYGTVSDTPAGSIHGVTQPVRVTLYTANVCPFCPIIRQRLRALQQEAKFELQEIDVTFRPEIVRTKGLRSVPVVEVNGKLLVGNATSAQLAEFLNTATHT